MGRRRSVHSDDLPRGFAIKDGRYYFVSNGATRKWFPLRGNLEEAKATCIEMKKQEDAGRSFTPKPPTLTAAQKKRRREIVRQAKCDGGRQELISDEFVSSLLERSIRNAKAKSLRHELTLEDVRGMLIKSGGRCQVSGVLFSSAPYRNCRNRPWVPSIDRINSERGYTKQNCRIVCFAVNISLNEWGLDVLKKIAEGVVKMNSSQQ